MPNSVGLQECPRLQKLVQVKTQNLGLPLSAEAAFPVLRAIQKGSHDPAVGSMRDELDPQLSPA